MVEEFVIGNERFLPTKVETEHHLERLVLESADVLFPHAYIFDFKYLAKTRTTGDGTKPDLCMVSHDCSNWWIIEVERSKPGSYVTDTIQPQIARQADADWGELIPKVRKHLIERGVKESQIKNLEGRDPGLILLYDDVNPLIEKIANYHGFKKIILKPMLSNFDNYALMPILQEVDPSPPEKNILRVKGANTRVSGGNIWIPLSELFIERIGERQIKIIIDNENRHFPLHPNKMISIPISNDKASQTSRLVYRQLSYIFDIEEDPGTVCLEFREEKRW